MKSKIFRNLTLLALMVSLFTTSCEKWIDTDLNVDPDSPREVYAALVVSSTQLNLAWIYQGFDYAGTTGMWLQYFEGWDRQAYGTYNYTYSSDDCNNFYGSLYAGVMMDCKKIIDQTSADGEESPHIRGIAKVMQAIALGTAVGVWGDMPFTEAFQGDANLKPKYDTEESLYTTIQDLLTSAITDLGASGTDFEEKFIKVAGQDLIYGGDFDQWIKTAYALKARYEIRLTRRGATKFDATRVLGYLANAYTSNDDDFQFEFTDNAYNEDNPLSQFSYERYFYAGVDQGFIDRLTASSDPRLDVYVAGEDPYLGLNFVGGYALGYWNSPALFMSYAECKFIEAECHWLASDPDAAATAYNEAVVASIEKWDVYDADWAAANANEDGASITLEKIMVGKYVAMYGQGEAWCDYRRYQGAYPVLTPPANNVTNGVQPQSYPYPTDEKTSNGENVPVRAGLGAKLWAFN